jgi:hypothetical protein
VCGSSHIKLKARYLGRPFKYLCIPGKVPILRRYLLELHCCSWATGIQDDLVGQWSKSNHNTACVPEIVLIFSWIHPAVIFLSTLRRQIKYIIAIIKRVDYCGNSQKNVHQNDLIYLSWNTYCRATSCI